MAAWLAAVGLAQAAGGCTFLVDGQPVTELACEAGGAWTVSCSLPEGPSGKVRIRALAPELGVVAEARVPLAERAAFEVPLAGPGGRAGGFVVDRATAGLLPGQAVGPSQWCPTVPPAGATGAPRLTVEVTVHRQTGFAEEKLDGGVVNRVPVYDAGVSFASGAVVVKQRPAGTIPVLTGPVDLPADTPVRGQLQLAGADGKWRSLGWTGRARELPVESGVVTSVVLDFVAPEVAAVSGADPVAWLQADLTRWLGGDPSSLIGHAGWARSGLEPPIALAFGAVDRGGRSWSRAADPRHDVRIGRFGDRVRVVIAWRLAPLDAAALAAIDDAATWDL